MVVYGDLLQKMLTKNRAYEVNKGETKSYLIHGWKNVKNYLKNRQ